jgi:C1A family cysteine protease
MLTEMIDLRPIFAGYNLPNRCQGSRGTCSVFTVVGGLEYAMAVKDGRGIRLSVEFLNWASHKAANRTADGGFFSELWSGYEVSGICSESDLPYLPDYNVDLEPAEQIVKDAAQLLSDRLTLTWIKEWDPNIGLTDAQLSAVKSTLNNRWPVLGGFRWPRKPEWCEGVLQVCPPEEVFDGHSVLLTGYRDDPQHTGGGLFLIRNSGGNGVDGFLPYAYVSEYMNDAAWIGCAGKLPPNIP